MLPWEWCGLGAWCNTAWKRSQGNPCTLNSKTRELRFRGKLSVTIYLYPFISTGGTEAWSYPGGCTGAAASYRAAGARDRNTEGTQERSGQYPKARWRRLQQRQREWDRVATPPKGIRAVLAAQLFWNWATQKGCCKIKVHTEVVHVRYRRRKMVNQHLNKTKTSKYEALQPSKNKFIVC